jgi:ribosomal protein S18 acetylase RimI-like enzyme
METPNITFALYQPKHYASFKETMQLCFADIEDGFASEEEMLLASTLYPRGQIVCLDGDKVVGINIARVVNFAQFSEPHTQADCIDLSRYVADTVTGDCVYGLDVCVHPDYQNLRLGKQIVDMLVRHTFEDNFFCMIGNSRVVNYPAHAHEMDLATYASKVKAKEIYDPALSFHMRNGMEFVNINPEFDCDDETSGCVGITLAIYNPDFDPNRVIYAGREKALEPYLVLA